MSAYPKSRPRNRRWRCLERLEHRTLLAGDVVINEIMAANSNSLADFAGDSSDWIELRNASDDAISLDGWYLTDDAEDLIKWKIPDVEIAAGAYLVLFASGKDLTAGEELHTNFRLRAAGEYLALTAADGVSVVSSFAPAYPAQSSDVSFGLALDAEGPADLLLAPTPGFANSAARLPQVVEASRAESTFVEPFELTLLGSLASQEIIYTLDGTVPDETAWVYDSAIPIEETTQVRARVRQGAALGAVHSWGFSQLSAEVAEFASTLPIMLIENFGAGPIPNKGFPNQTGMGTFQLPRQPASISLFETETDGAAGMLGSASLQERGGIRVRGAFSSTFSEPGYSLEFWDEANADKDVAPLDFLPHSDWVLYAPNPTTDRTLIDNTLLFTLSDQMGHWAPSFRYVETFVNTGGDQVTMDDHVGLYVIEDKVTRGEGRLELEKLTADASDGGWVLTVNRMDAIPEDDPSASPQHFHTAGPDGVLRTRANGPGRGDDIPRQYNAFINFEDPNGYKINAIQRDSIESWFAGMEDVLYGRSEVNWNDPVDGYRRYVDVESFIDYFILNNISNNGDGFLLSMWLYNPDPSHGGKLTMGPIWDADLGSFQGNATSRLRTDIDRLWYTRLFEDPEFNQQYIDRWFQLRQDTLDTTNVTEVIRGFRNTITVPVAERDGVADWNSRLSGLRAWLVERMDAIDNLYTPPVLLEAVEAGILAQSADRVYYTLDGTDPRAFGGQAAIAAKSTATGTISIESGFVGTVVARARSGSDWSAPTTLQIPSGDLNQDGQLDSLDVDYLLASIAGQEFMPSLDRNQDGRVDETDVDAFVETEWNTRRGDTNLDGNVDFADFLVLSANFGRESTWDGGNFDLFPIVDFSDFLILSTNFGLPSPGDD